jgi:hypothetical protein
LGFDFFAAINQYEYARAALQALQIAVKESLKKQ